MTTLHDDAYVFDFSPLGEPFVTTPAVATAMHGALARHEPISRIIRSMLDARLGELSTDQAVRDTVRGVWRASGVNGVQVTLAGLAFNSSDWDATLRDAAYWHRRTRAADDLVICTTADELIAAKDRDQVGLVLGTQDSTQIGTEIERLDLLYDLGVRVMQLTFNVRNLIGDGCTEREQAGLSKYGLRVLARLNELGIVPDVSHSGYRTTLDAIEHSQQPIAITHASCASVAPHPRAKTDDQLKALRDRDGYFGVLTVPFFIAPQGDASVDILADHVAHAAEIVGVERVGIGTDWGGWSPDFPTEIQQMARDSLASLGFSQSELPPFGAQVAGLDAWESWPTITATLQRRGFSNDEVRGIVGSNWLAFLRRAQL